MWRDFLIALHFESFSACQEYFGDKNHNFITRRVEGKTTFAYRNTWIFAYEDGEFSEKFKREKSIARKRPIRVTTKDGEVYEFTSYTNMEKHFGLKRCSIGGKVYMKRKKFGSTFDISGYHIEELLFVERFNDYRKHVSITEVSRVGVEISTTPKREAREKSLEDIV